MTSRFQIGSTVQACLVTKQWPVDRHILAYLPGAVVWDNSLAGVDLKVMGRYQMACDSDSRWIYTQDDDCIIDAARLCLIYRHGEVLCNMQASHQPAYAGTGISLVGWGAIFPRELVDFGPYLAKWPMDELFLRECDRVFTYLNRERVRVVDIGVGHLPAAFAQDRMGTETRHGDDLREIMRRLQGI